MQTPSNSRRKFLVRGMVSIAALPFAGALISASAMAQALKPLPADNATAKAMKYVADAKKATAAKPGSNCANCALFVAATKGCGIFPGFAVAPAGWCSAWAKKA
jgi:High potential iron-sulfur protein